MRSMSGPYKLLHSSDLTYLLCGGLGVFEFYCIDHETLPTVLEHEGVPPSPIAQWRTEAQLRLELLQPYAKQLILN